MTLALPSRRSALLPGRWVSNELWRRARAVPSLDLRFAENKSLVDATTGANLVTFTRASSGTYVDSQGVIRTATTNLLLQSENFSTTWSLVGVTISGNPETAPNGQQVASRVIETTATGGHYPVQNFASFTSGILYTVSVYAKAAERSALQLILTSGAFGANVVGAYDLQNKVASGSGGTNRSTTINDVGGGWYRCILSAQATVTALAQVQIRLSDTYSTTIASYAGSSTSGIYIWGAQLEQSATVGEYIPTGATINSAPRFDHNPTTGESLGLLVEEQRTNSIRNNTMQGAVAGAPGTLPTNWIVTGSVNGLTREVVGAGIDDGISYVDIRWSGTPTATAVITVFYEANTQITAANGQSWAYSVYTKLAAGSTTNIGVARLNVFGNTAAGAGVTGQNSFIDITPTTAELSSQRASIARTFSDAAVERVNGNIGITYTNGAAIDITLRIGMPQLEQGAFATSVIPTTGTAATRAADVASITGTNFSSWYRQDEGGYFIDYMPMGPRVNPGFTMAVSNSTDPANNYLGLAYQTFTVAVGGTYWRNSGVGAVVGSAASGAFNTFTRHAISVDNLTKRLALSTNGASVQSGTSTSDLPVCDQLHLCRRAESFTTSNILKRFTYFPQRLSNNVLQAITQ